MASHSASSGHPPRENAHKRRFDRPTKEFERHLAQLRGMRAALDKLDRANSADVGGDSPCGAGGSCPAMSEAASDDDAVLEEQAEQGDETLEALLTSGREKVDKLLNGLKTQKRVETLARLSNRFDKCARNANTTRNELQDCAVDPEVFNATSVAQFEVRKNNHIEGVKRFREDLQDAVHGATMKRSDSQQKRAQVHASAGPTVTEENEMRHRRRLEAVVQELREQLEKGVDDGAETDDRLLETERMLGIHREGIMRLDNQIDVWSRRLQQLEGIQALFRSRRAQAAGELDDADEEHVDMATLQLIQRLKLHAMSTRVKELHRMSPQLALSLGEERSLIEEKAKLTAEVAELREKTDDIAKCLQLLSGDEPASFASPGDEDGGGSQGLRGQLFDVVQEEKRHRAKLQDLQELREKVCQRRQLTQELKERLVETMKDSVKQLVREKPPPGPKSSPNDSSEPINWNRSRWGGAVWDAAVQTPEVYAWCMWPQLLGVRRPRRTILDYDPEEPEKQFSRGGSRISNSFMVAMNSTSLVGKLRKTPSKYRSLVAGVGKEQDLNHQAMVTAALRNMPGALDCRQRLIWNTLDILKSVLTDFNIDQPEVCDKILSRMSAVENGDLFASASSPAGSPSSPSGSPRGSFALGRMLQQPGDADSSQVSPRTSRTSSKNPLPDAPPAESRASGRGPRSSMGTDSNLVSPTGSRPVGKSSLQPPASPQTSMALGRMSLPEDRGVDSHIVGRLSLQLPGANGAPLETGRLSLTAPSLNEGFGRQESATTADKSLESLPAPASGSMSQQSSPGNSKALSRISTTQRMSLNHDMLDQIAALFAAQIEKLSAEHQKHEEMCSKIKLVREALQKAFPKPGEKKRKSRLSLKNS